MRRCGPAVMLRHKFDVIGGGLLKYYVGFAGLLALALACVVWVSMLATQSNSGGPENSLPPTRPIAADSASPGSTSARPTADGPPGSLRIPSDAERARVVDHVDGDTLHLAAVGSSIWMQAGEETTVRLLEIDTPESVDPNSPVQCYARRSSAALKDLLPLGSDVWVQADRELLDPYGRTLLYLWTTDGRSVNLEMVRGGYAKAVLFEPNDKFIRQMRRAEARARLEKRGLWGTCAYFGQSLGIAGKPSPSPSGQAVKRHREVTDPRFPYCSDAISAGYGDYVEGRDREYWWYDDADGDGVVCES